ncbi:PEP-CTERM protein-sorting domain-containing protein [Nitrosospira multiformis]|uniref:PEP-CTERM protein-sorting domain-containing protein n=1 Tax=Nitrosospira multiformis TaxID=1231 RepID=A0A1I0G1W6_9PROT|nr:PEP-CTERM sorting domain-containing protein [Nitrosospira multiformis]SET63974.1 PEP-CTERM protein-sorting domain-containing protein [Nitrosospira multiformis]
MNRFFRDAIASGVLLSAISAVQATPIYMTADFSGGILTTDGLANSLGLQQTSTCSGCAAGSVSGNVLFDQSLIPGSGTGTVTIALAAVTGASNSTIFDIDFGSRPLGFEFGDGDVLGGPSIQFNNGVFNGFFFVKDFVVDGKTYEINMQGANWTMNWLKSNSSSQLVASGYLNVGNQGLTSQTYFEPSLPAAELPNNTVSEPTVLALVMVGMLGIFMTRRHKQTYATA